MFSRFPLIPQHDAMDCGPACVAMIAKYYGREYPLDYLRKYSYITKEGVSLAGLTEASSTIGLDSMPVRTDYNNLISEHPLPCILYWQNRHFVVLYNIKTNLISGKKFFKIADPAIGYRTVTEEQFDDFWSLGAKKGIAFFLEPTSEFYKKSVPEKRRRNLHFFYQYLKPHKKELLYLTLCLAISSLFTLCVPVLTQLLIDKGITLKKVNIVLAILMAQITLLVGSFVIEIIRNWLLLFIAARINILIISDFFKKIMRLPLQFFDTRFLGDFHQRIQDHSRIESFLTSQSLTTFFSLINFWIFFVVLLSYDGMILMTYLGLTIIAIVWSSRFLKARERIDYYRFQSNALNNESVNEIINGIHEIKLNNFEDYKRNEWKKIQVKLFKINMQGLRLNQLQTVGFDLINQIKNLIVVAIAANEVVKENITLGALVSITYIIGQLNNPVTQLLSFFQSYQDAKLSMDRLSEVQNIANEDADQEVSGTTNSLISNKRGILIKDLSFSYEGPNSPNVLTDINLFIPHGKTTAIVGNSGSGKTTIMKLLLRFYDVESGHIFIDGKSITEIAPEKWRSVCGAVLQEGYIFSESIIRNIATKDLDIDREKLEKAIRIANIGDFIEGLSQKGNTYIGSKGSGISTGQRQRIQIARAVYKDPEYIFFDEATSALDTENEKIIHDNLKAFFQNRTVVIIAHRLSTVKNADQIIVLKEGRIMETGTHESLISKKGRYYHLVKNQLDLGRV